MKIKNIGSWMLNVACVALVAVPLLFFTGCRPAVLVVPSYIQNVGVKLFDNQTSYYGLETLLTQATIRALQVDGRLPVEDSSRADLTVEVIIRNQLEEPLLHDVKTNNVLQYRLSLVYDLISVDQREKKTILEDKNRVTSVYYYTAQYIGSIPETREQAMARLSEDLARLVVRRVLEGN